MIYYFFSFSVYFLKNGMRQGGLSVYQQKNTDAGADTDLMSQFCLRKGEYVCESSAWPVNVLCYRCVIEIYHLSQSNAVTTLSLF